MYTDQQSIHRLRLLKTMKQIMARPPRRLLITTKADLPYAANWHALPRLSVHLGGGQPVEIHGTDGVRKEVLRNGTALFFTSRAWWRPSLDCSRRFFGMVVHPGFVRYILVDIKGATDVQSAQVWFHTHKPMPPAGQHLLQALDELSMTGGDEATIRLMFDALIRIGHEHLQEDRAIKGGKAQSTWSALYEFVQENCSAPIDRASVGKAMGLHPNHVSRLFRQFAGESFNQVLRRLRMDRAKQLLRDGEMSIKAVAAECGYSSTEYFGNEFRRLFGTSPGRFRREQKV